MEPRNTRKTRTEFLRGIFFIVDQRGQAWTEREQPLCRNGLEGATACVMIGARWGVVPRIGTAEFSVPRMGIVRPFSFFLREVRVRFGRVRTARSSHGRRLSPAAATVNPVRPFLAG